MAKCSEYLYTKTHLFPPSKTPTKNHSWLSLSPEQHPATIWQRASLQRASLHRSKITCINQWLIAGLSICQCWSLWFGPVQFTGEGAVDLTKTKRASTLLCTASLAQKRSTVGAIGGFPATARVRVAFQLPGEWIRGKTFLLRAHSSLKIGSVRVLEWLWVMGY